MFLESLTFYNRKSAVRLILKKPNLFSFVIPAVKYRICVYADLVRGDDTTLP